MTFLVRTVAVAAVVACSGVGSALGLTEEETGRNTPYPQDNGGSGPCDNYRCGCGDSCGCGEGCGCGSSTAPLTVRGTGGFDSHNVVLLSRVSVQEFGSEFFEANDCWGYVSPSGREYALVGLNSAMAVVEITDPANPVVLGDIDHPDSPWADVKVLGDRAYVVNETGGGVQIVDLSAVDAGQIALVGAVDANGAADTSHNIAINEASGFAYLCGSNGLGRGLIALDLSNPDQPLVAGAYSDTYVHDAEIVTYTEGPYAGREIAFCYVGSRGLDVVDVTDKSNMFRVSRTSYAGVEYSHQGWLDRATNLLYLNDELDERRNGVNTTTRVFDVSDLKNPALVGSFSTGLDVIDHNLYERDGFIFEANYRSGLRVFDATDDPAAPVEAGYFDTFGGADDTEFDGAWSVYPFFPSGVIVVSDIQGGLFVLDPSFAFVGGVPAVIDVLGTRPELLAPTGQTLRVRVRAASGFALTETPRLVVDGESVGMTAEGNDVYRAHFPALACGATVSYYFAVGTTSGLEIREPLSAPATVFTGLVASSIETPFSDNFESDAGWTVGAPGDTANLGVWERAVPIGTDAAPAFDNPGGSGSSCFVTGNGSPGGSLGDDDVDGGATTLTSPLLDASGPGVAFLEYARWYSNDRGSNPNEDELLVEISGNGGSDWVTLETVDENASAWVPVRFRIDEFVAPSDDVRVRFIASDSASSGSIVEAGVDDVRVVRAACLLACPGDFNSSGIVGAEDLAVLLAAWGTAGTDLDGDGDTGSSDLAALLAAWGSCPE